MIYILKVFKRVLMYRRTISYQVGTDGLTEPADSADVREN